MENISSATCEIVDVIPTSSTVESTHDVTNHIEIQRMTVDESASVDAEAGCETKIAEEAGISAPVGSTQQEVAPCPVTGIESHILSDTSKQLLGEAVNNCLQNPVTTGAEKFSESQAKLSDNGNQECTKEVGMTSVLWESTEKQGDEVAVSFIKDDKEAIQENHDKSSSKISGDL